MPGATRFQESRTYKARSLVGVALEFLIRLSRTTDINNLDLLEIPERFGHLADIGF